MAERGCRDVYWDTLLKLLVQERFYLSCPKGLSVFRTAYICGLNDGSFKVPSELEKRLWICEDKHTKEPQLRILLPVNKVHCQQEMRKRGSVSWPSWWWEFYILVNKKLVAAFRKKKRWSAPLFCVAFWSCYVLYYTLEVWHGIPSFLHKANYI